MQYALPFDDVMEAQGIMEVGGRGSSDNAETLLGSHLVLWYGDAAEQEDPSSGMHIDQNGHAYFFNVFLSALMQNRRKGGELKKCITKDDLQQTEKVSEEDCGNRDEVCLAPKELQRGKVLRNVKEGARCDADPLGGDDTNSIYAQRLVNPSTCSDLLTRHVFQLNNPSVSKSVKDNFLKMRASKLFHAGAGLKARYRKRSSKSDTKEPEKHAPKRFLRVPGQDMRDMFQEPLEEGE